MNIVKLTNRVALSAVVILIYWVFIFVSIQVFGFKVFRQNITEVFMLSIVGLFSILAGAIILNIMFNLTAIAEGRNKQPSETIEKKSFSMSGKKLVLGVLASFGIIFALLYFGDKATSAKKEAYLVSSASSLINEQKALLTELADYSFTREYIEKSSSNIKFLNAIEEKFPTIMVITRDSIKGKPALLGFREYSKLRDENDIPDKVDYIISTSSEERSYLNRVFDGKTSGHLFSANKGKYEIYYPLTINGKTIVIYLSQHSRYGKLGS